MVQNEKRAVKRAKSISEEDLKEYMARKVQKMAQKNAIKLKLEKMLDNSNEDSNDADVFVWKKKIWRDVNEGVSIDAYSLEAEKKRLQERMAEIEEAKKRREQRIVLNTKKHEPCAKQDSVSYEDDVIDPVKDKAMLEIKGVASVEQEEATGSMEEGYDKFGAEAVVSLDSKVDWWHDKHQVRKPKYVNLVHTGYVWNKYNRTHYDHDHPPPKTVQGYKFRIFYPDLFDS